MKEKLLTLTLLLILPMAVSRASAKTSGITDIPDSIPRSVVHYQDGVPYIETTMVPYVDEGMPEQNHQTSSQSPRKANTGKTWTIGSGGNFADINAAMSDSRVAAGDVLELKPGTILKGDQTINKAIHLKGNGYQMDSDGNLASNVAQIQGYLYINAEGTCVSNLAISMFIDGNGSTIIPYLIVYSSQVVIEGCYINGKIIGHANNATVRQCFFRALLGNNSSGWLIQNNIIASQYSNGYNLITGLNNATINHNTVYSIFSSSHTSNYLITSSVSSCTITNNIIVHFPSNNNYAGTYNGTIESASLTNNTVSRNVFSGSSPNSSNRGGVNAIGDIFDYSKYVSSLYKVVYYDACFHLVAGSPAAGYATDGGDCGPWSGAYPYVVGGTVGSGDDNPDTTFKDGDIFTAQTAEGVEMTFQVLSAQNKTCQAVEGSSWTPCINKSTNGAITIPKSANGFTVTTIGRFAFYSCSGLTSIIIPNSVTSIKGQAFAGCSGLTSVTIPNSVTSIGQYAFNGCQKLTSVTIPNSMTSIDDYAFSGWNGLTSICIPTSVTSIGSDAFYGCSSLTSISIPNSVTGIKGRAFGNCSNLTSIVVESGNTKYDSRSNCNAIIETATNTLIAGCMNTVIPNSVTSIGYGAFYGCTNLTFLTIPSSVTSIGDAAFEYCSGLTSVTIPNSVTSIGGSAFYQCSGLTSVTIPNSVTSIGNHAFSNCSGLTSITIPNSVTSIGESSFDSCSGLTSVTIPNSVTSIGNYAFRSCSGLTSIVVDTGNAKYDSRSNCNAIIETATNTLIVGCKNTVIPNSVTSIGNYAFRGCSGLTSVIIPNSVTSIGEGAFYQCSGLKDVTIPNSVTYIGGGAFYQCSGLKDFWCYAENIPETGSYTFNNVPIASATLHVPTTSLGQYKATEPWSGFGTIVAIGDENPSFNDGDVFTAQTAEGVEMTFKVISASNKTCQVGDGGWSRPCIDKNTVGPITIPASIKGMTVITIAQYAFYQCNSLTSVSIPSNVTSIDQYAFYQCSGLTSVTIPNCVTSIGNSAFYGCNSFTSIKVESGNTSYDSRSNCNAIIETATNTLIVGCRNTIIPNSVTSIGNNAFNGCNGLTSVTIPNSVTSIGNYAFSNCSGLTSVTIPNSVTSIGGSAFSFCSGLTSVTIPSSVTSIGSSAFNQCSGLAFVIIPNSVTSIGSSAFYGCSSLTSVTIPNSVTNIGDQTFRNCSGLTYVTIPNSVTTIGNSAFWGCNGLTSVTIPNSVTYIGDYAFYGCSSLTSVTIPNSVTSIGSDAFYGCNSLTSVTIPNSVTSIGNYAFRDCCNLTTIKVETGNPTYDSRSDCNAIIETATNTLIIGCQNTIIPNNVNSISDYAFQGVSGLTSLTIPNSVTSIGYGAFQGCIGLTSVSISNSVKNIGSYAFSNCSGLTSVTSYIKNPFDCWNSFNGIPNDATLYVPVGTKSKYQNLADWNQFTNIEEMSGGQGGNWTIGTGGDFADINAAMKDERVKDGHVLQILKGTEIGNNYITKAVTIVGNGYEDLSDGYVSGIYIDCANVTLKNLYTGYIYVRHNDATIERCRANHITGADGYESEDITIRSCFVLGWICSNPNDIAWGWNISNNIIISNNYDGNTLDYLAQATIDHNLIINYKLNLNAIGGDVTESYFTNNIILTPSHSVAVNNTAVESAEKFEYNIISNSGTLAKWPINITSYNSLKELFVCNGLNTTDAYYKLVSGSPAIGYSNDKGNCGPWSGAFPYMLNGKEPDATQWKLDPNIVTDTQYYEFATLDALMNFLFNNRDIVKESVMVSVADAIYTMDMVPKLDFNSYSNMDMDEMINYLRNRIASRIEELYSRVLSIDEYWRAYDITFSMEAQHKAIFQFNLQYSQAYKTFSEFMAANMAAKIGEMQAQGMTQAEIEARKAEWLSLVDKSMSDFHKSFQSLISRISSIKTTNIIIRIDDTDIINPFIDPTQWKLDPTLTTDTERYEFATLDALFNFMLSPGSWYKEGMTDMTVSVADATYTMDLIPNINTSNFGSVDEMIKYMYYEIEPLPERILAAEEYYRAYNITFSMEAQHEAIFQFNLQNSQAYNAFLEFMAVKIVEMQAQGMTQEEIEARKAQWFAQIKEYMNRLYEAMQKFASHIKTTNIIIFLDNTRINPDPEPEPEPIEPNDLLALKNIYNMLGGSSWTNKKWKINDYGAKKEDFPGVTFDDEGYVVEINLENNNLRGTINPTGWTWQLCLPRLTGLYLQKNNISGDLSPWLKGVNRNNRLKALNMSYNNLTEISDTIPSSITSLNLENQNREWYRPDGVYTDPLKIEAMSTMTPIRLYLSANQTVVMPSLFTYNHASLTHSARPTIYIINAEGIDKYGYFKSSGEDTYSLAWKDNEYTEKQNAPCYVRFDNPYGSVYPAYLRYIEGDANMSGYTDVLDVQTTLNYVLNGGGVWQFNRSAANTYEDNLINVQDIVCMVNIVLNNEAVAEGIILNTSSSRRHLRRAADAMDAQGWLYTEKGRVMLTTVNEVGAIDLELKGVSTSQVSLLLNHSQYQMIGRNTEEGSRYVIFSPTGQPIPASEEVALLAVSSQTELIGAQAADMEAQELELAIGQPTGLEAIDNGQLTNDNAPIYNVAGQRLSKMQRGINITNGRKVLK